MEERHLCWPPYFYLDPAVPPPQFFHSRIATAPKHPRGDGTESAWTSK